MIFGGFESTTLKRLRVGFGLDATKHANDKVQVGGGTSLSSYSTVMHNLEHCSFRFGSASS
jgi:hypothetical protein